MKARELMTADPFTVAPNDTVARAAQVMRDLRIGCVPVVDDQAIPMLLGLVTDRDIAVRCVAREHVPSERVADVMTKTPLKTVTPDADVAEVVQKMEEAQVRRIPVVNDDGVLLGITPKPTSPPRSVPRSRAGSRSSSSASPSRPHSPYDRQLRPTAAGGEAITASPRLRWSESS